MSEIKRQKKCEFFKETAIRIEMKYKNLYVLLKISSSTWLSKRSG